MKLKTVAHQNAFNQISNFLGIKENGPGSFYLAAWILSYNEKQAAGLPLFQIGHAAGFNAGKLVSYMKNYPLESAAELALDYSERELNDVAAFLSIYEKAFGRAMSGNV